MDEIFFRELVIFLAVCLVFIGAIPLMIRGHYAKRIEAAEEVAVVGGGDEDAAQAKPRLSKKRRARARQTKRAQKGD
jgi:hypothetical protein